MDGEKKVGILSGPSTALKLDNDFLLNSSKELMESDRSLVYQDRAASLNMVGKDLNIKTLDTSCSIIRALKLSK